LFEHNSLDVLSLAGFLGHLTAVAGGEIDSDAEHHLALGKWDEQRRRYDEAVCQYRRSLDQDRRSEIGGEAVIRLARLLRRTDGWRASLDVWQSELETAASTIRRIRAHVEIAKIEEHRMKRYDDALLHAETASKLIEDSRLLGYFAQTRGALEKRIARLRRRVGD
jgi:tetratricopeptide (TPR) repeat protein